MTLPADDRETAVSAIIEAMRSAKILEHCTIADYLDYNAADAVELGVYLTDCRFHHLDYVRGDQHADTVTAILKPLAEAVEALSRPVPAIPVEVSEITDEMVHAAAKAASAELNAIAVGLHVPFSYADTISVGNYRVMRAALSAALQTKGGESELPDDLREPLHGLQADTRYLIGRVAADGSTASMVEESILNRLSQIESACYRAILRLPSPPTARGTKL